ncbi:hypothetical protein BDV27DRAFT_148828 [Aspergillus caelatus]|uniref:Uncharacterized protein n=1 Tax=Aspergillus caelatus TaxID=61420 RepID=A0A5N6ZTK6_9EURO|nr:uncharacterized protein BDV27DRAFT_148828 [Aspergillus caelatus]KAE8360286.1 hypothetical protein BDV27DRAFT_148828 [Aspergillus caelatus]
MCTMTINIPHWPVNHADIHKINQGRFIESERIDLQFITALRDNTRFSLAMNGRYLVFSNFAIIPLRKSGDDARMYVALFSTLVLLLEPFQPRTLCRVEQAALAVALRPQSRPEEWNPGNAENGF